MVNVIKEQKGSALSVRLSGSIEENVNFDQVIGAPVGEMHIVCKEVTRINSVGVKAWIKYFQGVQAKGTKLRFLECTVESVFVPFACSNCKSELVGLFKTDALRAQKLQLPDLKCSKCGGKAVFDDIPEEYFAFLAR